MLDINPNKRKRGLLSALDVAVIVVSMLFLAGTVTLALLDERGDLQASSVAYLAPAYGGVQNIWLAELDDPTQARPLTDSERGVFNFAVGPEGRRLAYVELDAETGQGEIMLLDLQTGRSQQLTQCAADDADCRTPNFHPDGERLIFERIALNSAIETLGPGALRLWEISLTQPEAGARPLFNEDQIIGHSAQWAADGSALAFYSSDIANPGILVYDFQPEPNEAPLKFVPSLYGTVGALSPDGDTLVFPEITRREAMSYAYLRQADLDQRQFVNLTEPQAPIDDIAASWHPHGQMLAIARRYTDERWTRGHQLYELTPSDGSVEPLIVDQRYSHGFFSWNATGDKLVVQRFRVQNDDGSPATDSRPEIWVLDRTDNSLRRVTDNAFHPRWVTP